MVGILNYGMGNLGSVQNALNYLDIPNRIITNPCDIDECSKLIIPGVGAFGMAMKQLSKIGFKDGILNYAIHKKRPVLGICLGMQLLLGSSTEHGYHAGLGLIHGEVKFLGSKISHLPIPHVGWNTVTKKKSSILLNNISDKGSFYFVHSYYCDVMDKSIVTGTVEYGIEFDVILEYENIFGCQFHPEKSQRDGLTLLNNFGKL